jgi:predicted esterase
LNEWVVIYNRDGDDHEKKLVGNDGKKVFLGGFSQGAQLTSYMQIAKLDFALGAAIVFDGFPLPPLGDMPGATPEAAKKNATYYGQDMKWMVWNGGADPIFPAKLTMDYYTDIFNVLGVNSTVKVFHTEPGQGHTLIKPGFDAMLKLLHSS